MSEQELKECAACQGAGKVMLGCNINSAIKSDCPACGGIGKTRFRTSVPIRMTTPEPVPAPSPEFQEVASRLVEEWDAERMEWEHEEQELINRIATALTRVDGEAREARVKQWVKGLVDAGISFTQCVRVGKQTQLQPVSESGVIAMAIRAGVAPKEENPGE